MRFSIRIFLIVLVQAAVSAITAAETFRVRQPEKNQTQILRKITIDKPSSVKAPPIISSSGELFGKTPYVAKYPQTADGVTSSQTTPSAVSDFGTRNSNRSSSLRRGNFSNRNDSGITILLNETLPEPARKKVTDSEIRKQLEKISKLSLAAKNGKHKPPEIETNAAENKTNNAAHDVANENNSAASGTNAASDVAAIIAKSIFSAADNPKEWFARLQDGSIVSVKKVDAEFYLFDAATGKIGTKVVAEESSGETETGGGFLSKGQEKQHATLLIVTTMAVLAAVGIGFLAFDYKHRWEQEVVNQNQRLTGAGNGRYSNLDSLEPDTLSFPQNFDALSATEISDHSFRTIA
ncbi:MAG: hypothetical protein LBT05_09405 [Planctomycetaceae bacterium]|nr:hypothetical protein [Planctomycetaceae bacterium]